MNAIQISESGDRLVISVPKAAAGANILRELAERLRFEELTEKAQFKEEDLLLLGNQIKANWWNSHKQKIEKDIDVFKELNGLS
jgi:hypothetical protein